MDGKQRLTATRLHALLLAEGQRVGVTVVKEAVAEWKRQRHEVFLPLTYRPGDLAEVDFFEVLVDVDGIRRKAWLFLMRLMYSGRDFAWIYERQDQISFLDGHVRAFAHFDGVPARVAYDNLRAAVVRIVHPFDEFIVRQRSECSGVVGRSCDRLHEATIASSCDRTGQPAAQKSRLFRNKCALCPLLDEVRACVMMPVRSK